MTAELTANQQSLYETDYLKWIETTIEQLQHQDYANVDWENLLDEIGDMARSERRRLESNLTVVLTHLLKWQFQPGLRSGSWKGSIAEHRRRIRKALKESPSLKSYLEEVLAESYGDAIAIAVAETGLPETTFSKVCAYTSLEVLNPDFLPD